jgi:hypothetical protein
MAKIKIAGDIGYGGSGLHEASGGTTLAQIIVGIAKFLRDRFDGPSVAAQGQIVCVAKASLVDGDYFTLGAYKFWFDVGGAFTPDGGYNATNIRANVSGATTATSVAAIVHPLVTASAAGIYASLFTGEAVVRLLSKTPGDAGNITTSENVANVGFSVVGMTGGYDEDAFSEVFEIHPSLG